MIYFYVASHSKTGLKYFGKTNKKSSSYKGSGLYWTSHIKKHGREHVLVEYVASFDNQEEATEFGLKFSADNNIVESNEWANLIPENGISGGRTIHTQVQRDKMSELQKASWATKERRDKATLYWNDPENKHKHSSSMKEIFTEERKEFYSQLAKKTWTGRTHTKETRKRMSKPRKEGTREAISHAKKGMIFSEDHKKALQKPKRRICRLIDKKEMSICHYTRWLNSL